MKIRLIALLAATTLGAVPALDEGSVRTAARERRPPGECPRGSGGGRRRRCVGRRPPSAWGGRGRIFAQEREKGGDEPHPLPSDGERIPGDGRLGRQNGPTPAHSVASPRQRRADTPTTQRMPGREGLAAACPCSQQPSLAQQEGAWGSSASPGRSA